MTETPIRLDDLTIEWLADALGGSSRMRAFDVQPMGAGVGLVGSLSRVALDWEGGSGPERVVVKLPAAGEESRFIAMVLRMYEREVRAYEHLTARSPLGSPTPYFTAFEPDTHDFTLVLSELHGRNPDQLSGCTEKEAALAVDRLAAHHGTFWDDTALDALTWLPRLDDPAIVGAVQIAFQAGWEVLAPTVDDLRTAEVDELCARFPELVPALMGALSRPPLTLAHGDFRLDNMFFDGSELSLCDWQLVSKARGPYDLAYFTTQSITVEQRREWERDLITRYADGLVSHGVSDYSLDDITRDYRVATLFCLVYPVIAGGSLTVEDTRHVTLCRALFERCVGAVADWECIDLVS
jgi:hypothetical protein